jgi:hypothetical protein
MGANNMKFAGQALQRILDSRIGQAMMAPATKEVAKASVPGAVLAGGYTMMAGGGIPAALATGGLDIGLSTLAGRLAGKITPQALSKVTGQRFANFLAGAKPGELSTLQQIAMGGGSVAAAVATYPLYAGAQIANLSEQELQQLMAKPIVMDQTATAEQQLIQRDLINNLQAQSLSPGTMFQVQGIESTLGRANPSLDPYGIMRGDVLR